MKRILVILIGFSSCYSMPVLAAPYSFGPNPNLPWGGGSAGTMGQNVMQGLGIGQSLSCSFQGICPGANTSIATSPPMDARSERAFAARQGGFLPYPGEHYTRSYMRRDGTYVAGHYSTNPDKTKLNNWSTRGNINPHTGSVGYRNPYDAPNNTPMGASRFHQVSVSGSSLLHHHKRLKIRRKETLSQEPLPPPVPFPPDEMDR
ncbi:hypothetical protein GS501_06565 [Saccharibacter sp. 17.LH.SD]|uniref:hypothetical protein n=1 Tax=Saccharibacter sp. 17.LH.SD TaxID=2689393 RepID=UPI00136BFEF9|nr:hypothetical protein [Saccharibacter sp. 17.LH.SD]MXV44705.1 hypothetical protein [Saccharibacter sp. 17.LH.SD]